MSDEFKMMYTAQADIVLDTLARDGVYYVKKSYVQQKYRETAWIFREAYDYFIRNASEMVAMPPEAESPIWLYEDPLWALPEAGDPLWALPEAGTHRLQLSVPREELLLFDRRKWNQILNLSYIGTEEKMIKNIFTLPFFFCGAADCRGIAFSCIDNPGLFSYNEARKEKEAVMQSKAKIVIADDEKEIREVVSMLLTGEGYEVAAAADGREALELADPSVDLYILDVNMPGMTGFAAAAEIRKTCYAPILFLTAYSGESDKMMGFSAGGDDYLVKPFSNVELLLRVRAHLRRVKEYAPADAHTILYKDLTLDLRSQSVRKGNELIVLTYTEYQILKLFLEHRGKIFSMENIYQSVWEDEPVGDGSIMTHIKNLRKKLKDDSRNPQYIKTAWGKGYYVE